jgi:dTMP kinase
LVVFEGIDGGGKSTLSRALASELRGRGHEVLETREPTDGPIGRQIRALAASGRDQVSPDEEFRLFHEDRKIHVLEVVRPALARGAIVLQDRSHWSSYAYQGERGVDRARILAESRAIAPEADVLFVIDLPAEVALERIQKQRGSETDDFERLESLRRIREVFRGIPRAVVLDGGRPPSEVAQAALERIASALAKRETS